MNERIRVLTTTSIYHALNDSSVAVIPILFPIFKLLFQLNYTQVGIITGGGLLLTIIAQIVIGRKADGRNFPTLLSVGVLLTSASLLIITQSHDFITLLLYILLIRFSSSFFHPIGIGWISRTFKKSKLDWAMGIQSGSADLGAFIAIATTLYLTELTYWQFPLFLWSILGIIGLLIGIMLSQNLRESLTTLKNEKKRQTFKEALGEGLRLIKNIKLLVPAFMISGAAWGITITYLPLLLNERTTLSLPAIGMLIAIWVGIGGIASFLYSTITSYLGRKNVIIFSYLTIGIMGIFLTIFTNVLVLLVIMILLGIAVFLTYPALFSFVSEVTQSSVEGRTFGIIFTLQLGGGALLLFAGGILSDLFGIWMPFFLLGTISILFMTTLIIYYKKPYALASEGFYDG
ncbi:MAG: MFS transporter [Thermoplasmatales archaeon]|nr:MAG: MFS transporter [Thermoplasmatales archaeon]